MSPISNPRRVVVHGRFQPFHIGHFEYVEAAMKLGDELVIGLTQCQGLNETQADLEGPQHRFQRANNPLTYHERSRIVRASLMDLAVPFTIAPFPIERPELLGYYVGTDAIFACTLHEEWNTVKVKMLSELGFDVAVVNEGETKRASGIKIREQIRSKDDGWKASVCSSAVQIIESIFEGADL